MRLSTLEEVAERLKGGQVGLFPFDTIWGITGIESTATRIASIKQRPATQPFIKVIPDLSWVNPATNLQRELIAKHWPGPVTLRFSDQIALRLPAFEPLNQLLFLVNQPLITTSANLSGKDFPKTFQDISPEVINRVDFYYAEIEPLLGRPSLIIDATTNPPTTLR